MLRISHVPADVTPKITVTSKAYWYTASSIVALALSDFLNSAGGRIKRRPTVL